MTFALEIEPLPQSEHCYRKAKLISYFQIAQRKP